jgi:antitoxin HigA-1
MAIKSFADDTTADIYRGINSKAARRIPQQVWKPAQRKMSTLNAANDTRDLSLPGLHFEPLKHDRPGFNSIRVNDQYAWSFDLKRETPLTLRSKTSTAASRRSRPRPEDGADLAAMRRPPTHPGEVFEEEWRKPSGISQAEAARRMGMSTNRLNEIVAAKRGVTAETAVLFGELTGTNPQMWLHLQADHDLWRVLQERKARGATRSIRPIAAGG